MVHGLSGMALAEWLSASAGGWALIDLHSHILPGMDDGSPDLETSLAMARLAVADGIEIMACTPHVMPGVYVNTAATIRSAIDALTGIFAEHDIALQLIAGADVHISPTLRRDFADDVVPTIHGSRYFLFEPPHHVVPPRLADFAFDMIAAGYHPILTHPERLTWIEGQYDLIERMFAGGVLIQLTAGSLTGRFGRRPRYWAERMLGEGKVHLLATDAHDARKRPPLLAEARDAAASAVGDAEAERLVATNPLHILKNVVWTDLQPISGRANRDSNGFFAWMRRFGRARTGGVKH